MWKLCFCFSFFASGTQGDHVDGGTFLKHLHQRPPLQFAQRLRFDDFNLVTNRRIVVLVVDVTHRSSADEFFVLGMLDHAIDLDAARLVHFVAGHDSGYDAFWHDVSGREWNGR